jgi:hypothetical protein
VRATADPYPNSSPEAPVLRLLGPVSTDLSLDDLAESIRRNWSTARLRGMEAADAYLATGRDLLDARSRFPSDRRFGEWCAAQRFGFSRQWSLTLRSAAEREPEVRALLTTYLSQDREPSFTRAVDELRNPRSGPPGCDGHEHVAHPFPRTRWLCLDGDADPAERIAWADELQRVQEAHRDAERQRPPGDGQPHDKEFMESVPSRRQTRPVPPAPPDRRAVLLALLQTLREERAQIDERIERIERELATLDAETPPWEDHP